MEVLRDKAFIHVSSKASKSAFNQQTRRALSRTRSGLSYRIRSNQRHHQSLEDGSNDPEEAKSTSYVPANKRTSRPEGKSACTEQKMISNLEDRKFNLDRITVNL